MPGRNATGGTTLAGGRLNVNTPTALGTGPLTVSGPSTIANTSAGPITLTTNNAQAWNADFTLASGYSSNKDLDFGDGAVTLGGDRTVTVTGNTFAVGGPIGGASSLTKYGDGTLILSGESTYTGSTSIMAGTLRLSGGDNRLPTGKYVTLAHDSNPLFDLNGCYQTIAGLAGGGGVSLGDGATLTIDFHTSTASYSYASVISGSGNVVINGGSRTQTRSGASTYSGSTIIIRGHLQLAGGSDRLPTTTALVLADATSASLVLNNQNQTIGSLSGGGLSGGSIDLGYGTLTVGDASDSVYAGYIKGSNGKLVKQGTGTLTRSRHNGYNGATTILAGTLALGCDNALSKGAPIILDGGTLATNGFSQTNNVRGWLTLGGDSSIDMGVVGGSILAFDDSSSMPWSGTLTIRNWNGAFAGGGEDQLFFGSSDAALTWDQLREIVFFEPNGLAGDYSARILATGEVVPVPEPALPALAASGGLFLVGLAVRRWRRRTISA